MDQNRQKRCICGYSSQFPLCDGSHKSQGWTCLRSQQLTVPLCVGASSSLQNFSIRFAHRFQGLLLSDLDDKTVVKTLVLITDGSDIAILKAHLTKIQANESLIIGIGIHTDVLKWAFPQSQVKSVADQNHRVMWSELEKAYEDTEVMALPFIKPPKVFVSHAVSDEELRQYMDQFLLQAKEEIIGKDNI